MANTVNLGRFTRWLEKFYNVKGGRTIIDIQPEVQIGLAMDKGVDHRVIEGWNRFAVAIAVAALAANFGRVRIRNPVGSNVICVIEQISFFNQTAGDIPFVTWGAVTSDLTTVASLTFTRMDPRGNPQPTSIVSSNAQAAGGVGLLERAVSGLNVTTDFIQNQDQEIPNLPGQAIDLQSGTANSSIVVSLMWRERALEQSELT